MMRTFLSAVQFLTIIPIGIYSKEQKKHLSASTVYFPLVGLGLGVILVGLNALMLPLGLPSLVRAVFLVVSLTVLTGGLHLDGLADTFDGFLSRKSAAEMLKIMRDPHVGVMGVLSVISIILVKISILASLQANGLNRALILMCVLSRFSLTELIFLFPYVRTAGKGRVFFSDKNRTLFAVSAGVSLLCALVFWQLKGVLLFFLAAVFVYCAGKYCVSRLGGMTGDTLGAVSEVVEGLVLLVILIFREVAV